MKQNIVPGFTLSFLLKVWIISLYLMSFLHNTLLFFSKSTLKNGQNSIKHKTIKLN